MTVSVVSETVVGAAVVVVVNGEVVVGAAVVAAVVAAATSAGVGVSVVVTSAVGVGVAADAQIPLVIVLESRVTAPFLAINCPWIVAPRWADIDVNAKM